MAGKTKMIIITSNEDLIRQFSLNKNTNTHIIDLDDNKQIPSITTDDNNSIDLALLAELSELNSGNDQVFKRALDSAHEKRPKSVKSLKKSHDFICRICGDRAIGFNYDVLSCASCKAFFHRNANQPSGKIKCLTGHSQCVISYEERRKCPRCRLDRCFSMGMRKDLIVSEEEKQRKQKRLEENRNKTSNLQFTNASSTTQVLSNSEPPSHTLDDLDQLLMDMNEDEGNNVFDEIINLNPMEDVLLGKLPIEDWLTLQSVQMSFLSVFQIPTESHHSIDLTSRTSTLIGFSQYGNQLALRYIHFIRQIDEFESLHNDDRFILIKYNILALFPISKCFFYKPTNNVCSDENNADKERQRHIFSSCDNLNDVREIFEKLVVSLVELTEQDSMLLSLLLVALIFSQGLSMNEDEPSLKDPLAVNRAQSYYTKLLWDYLLHKWGDMQTHRFFTKLLTLIFRMQSAAKIFRDFFRAEFITPDNVDTLEPLMQTILHIS